MNWDILLIGGHSTSGKSTIAQLIGRRLGIPVIQVDDLRLALQRVTKPSQIEGLHYFQQPEDQLFLSSPESLVEKHIRIASVMSNALEAVIAHHVFVGQPIIIEGDGILPSLAKVNEIDGLPVASRMQSVFLIGETYGSFAGACRRRWPGEPGPRTDNWTQLAWLYGQWMRRECERLDIAVVESEPWETLEDRVMGTLPKLSQ